MIGFAVALLVNYPNLKDQSARLNAHAKSIVLVTSMIFAAGIFSGILNGTGMIAAMADSLVSIVPDSMARFLPLILAVISMPLSLVFTPDAFYYGMLPILAQAVANFGMDPIEIGRAAIFGQMTVGFPLSPLTASTFSARRPLRGGPGGASEVYLQVGLGHVACVYRDSAHHRNHIDIKTKKVED
ncbi:hypothetical protein HMSSN036_92260 [Paenibacillus macerans]|nr:hypothetical protein HMSSN036_92260 [Paenibacillus macerans]